MLKSVGYAYATSPYAVEFGRAKDGCYIITTHEEITDPGKAMGPFDTAEAAYAFADDLPCEYSPYTMQRPE